MSKEKNPLLNIEFTQKRNIFYECYYYLSESLYSLFDLILDDPIENIWLECFNIILGYSQLIAYIFDSSVSLYQFLNFHNISFFQFGTIIT